MPNTATRRDYSNSKLIHSLRELSLLDGALPHSRFVATLGKYIDFSEAMSVSELLNAQSKASDTTDSRAEPSLTNAEAITKVNQYYLKSRGEMMQFIAQSFITENCPVSLRLPLASDKDFSHEDLGLSSYLRFYSLHQSGMEAGILKLQNYIRRCASSSSVNLSKLTALDSKLSSILMDYTRKSLGNIPLLLAKRFNHLCFNQPKTKPTKTAKETGTADQDQVVTASTGSILEAGLPTFFAEMQNILLAELDTRLQPTLGLLETLSLEKEESTK